jgi:hypothetical protein
MALEGTLKDFALPDIFQLIGLQKKTGVLRLKNETDEVIIAFKDGLLVSADSKTRRLEERLGTRLVRSMLITEGQLHDVMEKQKQTLQRIGIVLVNEGVVRQEDLRQALEIQVTQVIYRVFRWDDGDYRFDQDAQIDYDRENFLPISAESILMGGMRVLDEWPIVEKVVRSMAAIYEKLPVSQPIVVEGADEKDDDDDFDFSLAAAAPKDEGDGEKITLSAEEGAVYNLLDGQRTVEDLMYLGRLSDFDTCKAIYDLLNRALIRERTSTGGSSRGVVSSVLPQEASPVVVGSLIALIAALTLVGAAMFSMNPLNRAYPIGFALADTQRQDQAATATRLDHIVRALEAERLASGDTRYPGDLEELVDSGFVRRVDTSAAWGTPFDYTALEGGQGYRVQAPDEDDQVLPTLERSGGEGAQ